MLHSINTAQRLYVLKAGDGVTCYGFDNAEREIRALAKWLKLPMGAAWLPAPEPGTREHFDQLEDMRTRARERFLQTGDRCPALLSPQLIGLEGHRVAVFDTEQDMRGGVCRPRRFIVGRSTGWMPIHLEIAKRNSSGGMPASRRYWSIVDLGRAR